ncbi:MAG: transglutaminase-like domain-containing protein [Gemmataceae bacterium]
MLRTCLYPLALLLIVSPARAQEPVKKAEAKPLIDAWQAAYFEGLKVGHTHRLVRRVGEGEKARYLSTHTMHLVIKRYGGVVPITIEQTCEETAEGKVLALGLTQTIGAPPRQGFAGKVEDGEIAITVSLDGKEQGVRKLPFPADALGLYAQEAVFARKKVKPGDKLAVTSFEIALNGPLTIRAVVKDKEKVDQLAARKDKEGKLVVGREPAVLLRVETTPDKVNVGGTEVQLPAKTVWLDEKLLPAREQFEMPGLGMVTLYNTTKEAALKEGVAPDRLPDFGLNINIPLKQTIDDPYRTKEAVYRVTMKDKLNKVFAQDARQTVRNEEGKSLELVVRAEREPGTDDTAMSPGKEFLEGNLFVDSDDERVKRLALAITGKVADPWKKALAVERWVHDNMKVSTSVGFPNASKIAKDLEGDCRQHALLLVALCRAAGVPARTAIGLIYVKEPGQKAYFGYHMWGEVWVRGRWLALDAVLGEGGVGATHLKMADHSWAKTETLAPLLPISQTLGKLQIEVVGAK